MPQRPRAGASVIAFFCTILGLAARYCTRLVVLWAGWGLAAGMARAQIRADPEETAGLASLQLSAYVPLTRIGRDPIVPSHLEVV